MKKSRKQEVSEKADEERRRCCGWLLKFICADQPKFLTKTELREAATRELGISKHLFDEAWIIVIEETGRQDWYEPLRRRLLVKN